ncbi:MAG: hypothetical protein G01um1014107_179 [Parcubacteria group bacterium Gr01-1014_107]|nr:MAG: hypothetical protein G01um1014107_179 [Parcubacteria group bacterium Gr01-1014_107]
MLTLFKTEILRGRHLPELVKKAQSGDLIAGLGHVRGEETWPHFLGVMQRVEDKETAHCYYIGGEMVFRGQCTECLPFYEEVLIRRGNEFFLGDRLYYKYSGVIKKCLPHPGGGVVIEEEDKITLLGKKSVLGRKVKVLNQANKPFEGREYTTGGVITQQGNQFFFNGQLVFEWREGWKNEQWWPFGEQVLVKVGGEEGSVFFLNGNEQYRVSRYENIILLPHLGGGFIVTRDGFYFTLNGRALEREIPCDRASFHPSGVLIERKGEYSLLVIK